MTDSPVATWRMRIEFLTVRVLTNIMRNLSLAQRHAWAQLAGRLWYHFFPFRKKVILSNLRLAFPTESSAWRRKITLKNLQQVCRWYFDLLPLYQAHSEEFNRWVSTENTAVLQHTLNLGRGCLIVAYHYGNWEILADWLGRQGFKVAAVAQRQKNILLNRWLTDLRQGHGLTIFLKSKRNTWQLKHFLNAGGILLLLADQDARRAGIFVDFLGRKASTHRGPALFALYGNVPILTAFCLWTGKNYRIRFDLLPWRTAAASFEEKVTELTQQIADFYTHLIRQAPEHYYWLHRRWKTRPAEY